MNFLTMDYFIMVANERSFTKAAESLHITQQTLSVHIATLEKELGCQLFIRHVPLDLTYAGDVFLQYARDIQNKYRDLQREFSDISNNREGRLRIGAAPTRGRVILPAIIEEFQIKKPEISIQMSGYGNDELQRALLDGEIDVAIANFPEKLAGISLGDFYDEEIVMLASDAILQRTFGGSARHIADEIRRTEDISLLKDCPFVMNAPHDLAGKVARALMDKVGFRPHVRAQSDNVEMLLDLCVRGVGICFCPEIFIRTALHKTQLDKLSIFHFSSPSVRFPIRFAWLEGSYQWNIASEFMELAVSKMKAGHF